MKMRQQLLFLIIMFLVMCDAPAWSQEQRFIELLLQAEKNHQRIPVLSVPYPAIDVETAYQIQNAYIAHKLLTETLAGFKAGLTSTGIQQQFNVNTPVAGALFASGKLSNQAIVDSKQFHQLMIETEIGLILGETITKPLPDVAALRATIHTAVPVIELPDVGFSDMSRLTGVDIIAANVTARQFIVGTERPVADADLNDVNVRLSFDGKKIHHGTGSDAYGDQWRAAYWLVNTVIEHGWKLEAGHLLLTGSLGPMALGKPGKYVADYGAFGTIRFEVK